MTDPPSPDASSAGAVHFDTLRVMRAIRQTRNWLLFLAVLMILGAALVLSFVVMGTMMSPSVGIAELLIATLITFVMIGIYVIPAVLMLRFASRSKEFLRTGSPHAMVESLAAQRWLWTLLGIYVIVYIVMLIAAILFLLAAFVLG